RQRAGDTTAANRKTLVFFSHLEFSLGTTPIFPPTDCERLGVVEEHGGFDGRSSCLHLIRAQDEPSLCRGAASRARRRHQACVPRYLRHRNAAEVPRRNFRRVTRRESRRGLRRRNVLHAMVLPARVRNRAGSLPGACSPQFPIRRKRKSSFSPRDSAAGDWRITPCDGSAAPFAQAYAMAAS